MSKFKFVGFQEHVEIPAGYELLEVKEVIITEFNRDALFLLLATPAGLSEWFYRVRKLDSRPGGKVTFEDSEANTFEGRCTAVAMGRDISLLADPFGQVHLKITPHDNGSQLEITFAIMTDKKDQMSALYLSFINRLKALL